ncbi:unnamed protein product [Ophioblennius macclurei]
MTEETADRAPASDSGPEKGTPEEGTRPREKWANNMEFILSVAGEIIGSGIIWRFPYMCYVGGGVAYLIPYIFFLVFCGIPVFFLETALGQFTSEGGVTAWRKICPMFEGLGIASQVVVTFQNIYYIVTLAWALFYLIHSFMSPLPWSTCNNHWNTEMCHSRMSVYANPHLFQPESNWSFLNNFTSFDFSENLTSMDDSLHSLDTSEEEFWKHRMLGLSDEMSMVKIRWDLALCLLAAWIVCYFCVWKGIRTTGKVVYFTATVPYLLLFILFVRGVTLPGAAEGLRYYLQPDFDRMGGIQIWLHAGLDVFTTYSVSVGVLTALGSYNKYNNNCYRDCLVLCCLKVATGLFGGFVYFSLAGFLAHDMNVDMSTILNTGTGAWFVLYPKALSMLPGASFWAVLFFFMLFLLGLDTQFVCVEGLATAITDMFPHKLRRPRARELLVLAIAVICFLLGLPLVSDGGAVLFSVFDVYGVSGITLLIIACLETIVIGWVYGADRFFDNIEDMTGYRPYPVMKYCWLFVTPLMSTVIALNQLSFSSMAVGIDQYRAGYWSRALGFLFLIVPLICIPIFILVALYRNAELMAKPSSDLRQARPHKPILTMCGCVIFKSQAPPSRRAEEGNEKMMMAEASRV